MSIGKKIVIIIILALILSLFFFLIDRILPTIITNHRLELAALSAKNMEVADGYVFGDTFDWWGQPVKISCGPTDDGLAFVYTAISSGKDKVIGTGDDLQKTQIDLNKSKMLGHYTAKKLKEFVKGFKEGEKNPSKFDGR